MAPSYKQIADLMYFRGIDAFERGGVLTIGWRFTDMPDEPWTTRFNMVKDRQKPSVHAAAETLGYAMNRIKFPNPIDLVVGAISSSKTQLDKDDPVYQLGLSVATVQRVPFRPGVLRKIPHKSLHTIGNAGERANTVRDTYSATTTGKMDVVLIIDDFVTRGDTFSEITRALESAAGKAIKVYGLALAKTERVNYPPNADISNNHIPDTLLGIWDSKLLDTV